MDKASRRAKAIDRGVMRNRSTIKAIERDLQDGGDPGELAEKLKAAAVELERSQEDLDEVAAVITTQRAILKKVKVVSADVDSKKLKQALSEAISSLRSVETQIAAVQDEIDTSAQAIRRLAREL